MAAKARPAVPVRNVVPDRIDLRDRRYMPPVSFAPKPRLTPRHRLPVLDQGDTNACTGFALASVIHFLTWRARGQLGAQVSPFMLYSMARRYDEFPGAQSDTGSSLRGALKGWYKHGACSRALWDGIAMPAPVAKANEDWWLDAARRPLGAYYRLDTRSVTDMQVALADVGVLYASVVCHSGWDEGSGARGKELWTIPQRTAKASDGGHAIALVGYDDRGFVVQNSWGKTWGTQGLARLTYEDWLDNAMDCWVTQLGVVTEQHLALARATTLRTDDKGKVALTADTTLRDREITPFIIDMENNGRLSSSGRFRTQESDVSALVTIQVEQARRRWNLDPKEPIDIAIYAHGGLVSESDAAANASDWIPKLYDARILPIFLMWETDLWSTLAGRLQDVIKGLPRPTAGIMDRVEKFWDERLERMLAPGGTQIWGEMKQNADALSALPDSGGQLLYSAAKASPALTKFPYRLHLIGHSAGTIAHSFIVDRLAQRGWKFDSVSFMAPAVTVDLFRRTVLPRLKDGTVKRMAQFHLSDQAEQHDNTCRPILLYSRSLLYLVSDSFEGGRETPILGMQKWFDSTVGALRLPNLLGFTAPSAATASTTHGGFDNDHATQESVIRFIKDHRVD